MQHKHPHKRENWPLREIAIGGGVAAWMVVGSTFAVTSSEVPPLVVVNRFAVAAPADADAKPPASEPPAAPAPKARPFDSVIDRLLAPATEGFEDEAASESQQMENASPVEEATKPEPKTPAEPDVEPMAETEAKSQPEPESEVAETAATPPESQEPPAEPTAAPAESVTQPAEPEVQPVEPPSAPWQPDMAPSNPWHSNAGQPEPEVGSLPPEPPAAMLDEMDAVWSDEFQSEPEPAYSGAAAATPYAPTVAELSLQLLPSVRKAYGLAQHGAVYAAQTEFIQVLRRIAQSKDAAEGVDEHSRALAMGLRALDEADDFVPQGTQLEGEMNVSIVASAHRTPVLDGRHANVRPDEAIALYHQYAREQLARAVAGEQAGSMALYGLGKVQNRLAYESEGELRHERNALVMFLAALDAGPGNHLAANEIGVLYARGGQPAEASAMFRRAIDATPTSTSYHNLAVTELSLGQHEQAAANEKYAQYLAARDRATGAAARRSGIEWVSPQDLSRVAQPTPIPGGNGRVVNDPRQAPPQPARLPNASSPVQTVAKWPQKLVPGIFRR